MIEGVGEGGEIASQTQFHFHVVNVVFSLFSFGSLSVFFGNFVSLLKLCNLLAGAMIGEMEMTDGMGDGVGTEGVEIGGALITTGMAGFWKCEGTLILFRVSFFWLWKCKHDFSLC